MTRESDRLPDNRHGPTSLDDDIIAALWEEVHFPRLPLDAPNELKELLVEIENPKRVYAIHRAYRRHNLQLLIEKFIFQLRYGCGCHDCTTAFCFSCRKRLAGKAPIRRYSPTSARTLAVYLAGQDNPESLLCPNLQSPDGPNDAIKTLIFGPKPSDLKQTNGHARGISPKEKPRLSTPKPRQGGQNYDRNAGGMPNITESTLNSRPHIPITERPIRKDYRSFAANVFGTVAFKMLEWLTPNNMEAMTNRAANMPGQGSEGDFGASSSSDEEDGLFVSSAQASNGPAGIQDMAGSPDEPSCNSAAESQQNSHEAERVDAKKTTDPKPANCQSRPEQSRRNSNARVRTSTPKPQPKASTDTFPDSHPIEPLSTLKSPRAPLQQEKVPKTIIRSSSTIPRQISRDHLLDTIADENVQESLAQPHSTQADGVNGEETASIDETLASVDTPIEAGENESSLSHQDLDSESDLDNLLPQSLSRLSLQAVNFICDVLQEDHTTETHLLEPQIVGGSLKRPSTKIKLLRRKRKSQFHPSYNLRLEWKLFVEQSIFNVLSDPYAILESFTNQDGLIDSQTLWYCMLRMTRTSPSLVFDSLWDASASLFAPPKALQSPRSPTSKVFQKHSRCLTNQEAGFVLSVCFHALVAAAPLVTDSRQLFDMSRIRSRGLTLAESGAVARQPSSLCLQYEDAFSDDMALRLARRLLAAIPTRRYFDTLIELDLDLEDGIAGPDMIETLLSHLEFPAGETQPLLEFPHAERDLHEKRVPILLLDWARAVIFQEWSGHPEVPGDGPFGGALSLIAAMYQKRNSLLLTDVSFRAEYLGDRLDTIEMPVSWLAFNSTRHKVHLLDYPYMFHPSSLVSYFRAINFSRMSRSYEESSSLQSRINAIIAPDSLVTDQHQKSVLQDLLKTASAKFLILDIGRKTVIRDAFDQLWRREERELMRPLKIHLGEDSGEEGFDSGGVQQEFFRLAIAEALNPDYGAFTVDERTRMTWFQPGSLQPEWKFELIGLLISLAVYNGLTLPITFPKALYRKILGEPVTELHHIADGWPDLANGLTTLLEWDEKDGAVEDIFARTYEFSISMFGLPVSREMQSNAKGTEWPQFSAHPMAEDLSSANPEDAPLVTGDNRNSYVSDYISYLTDVSVAPQFEAFARGFKTCLNAKSLQLLTPPLLQSIVEGTQDIDISELRRATRYVGWDASHRTVRDFWSIVKRYDDTMKRKLLEFVTASDRVPVGGMRNIQFVVQRNGEEEGEGGHLPTAYTCYGTLLLPEYRDRDVLRERLAMALENAQGFGFA